MVPHRSANWTRQCLSSVSIREAVFSLLYGPVPIQAKKWQLSHISCWDMSPDQVASSFLLGAAWTYLQQLCDHNLSQVIKYANGNKLANTTGWKWVPQTKRQLARQSKRSRLETAAHGNIIIRHLRNSRWPWTIKYDNEVPCCKRDALLLDQRNNNQLWHYAIQKQLDTMSKYKFVEKKHRITLPKKKHYKYIGTRKALLVAGGNVIRSPKSPLY